jgi:ankyrin repeat protein
MNNKYEPGFFDKFLKEQFPIPETASLTHELIQAVQLYNKEDHKNLISQFIKNSPNKNAVDREGHSLLHFAVISGKVGLVKYFLSLGFNKELEDDSGFTPLMYGILKRKELNPTSRKKVFECLDVLLEAGAHSKSTKLTSKSAPNIAAMTNDIEVIKLLDSYGVSLTEEAFGTSPLWWAKTGNPNGEKDELINYLTNKECSSSNKI